MALQVIGSGFGRTGTKSLKLALEQLGFGPCHHMREVFENPDQLPFWQAAAAGALPDWDAVFRDYRASVDWPAARFWRELARHYPDAKVLHSVRPAERWVESLHATVYPLLRDHAAQPPGHLRDTVEMAHAIVATQTFGGRMGDRAHALAVYRAHTDAVRRAIPTERLLVYDVAQGWAPLCQFLDVAVSDGPFPSTNGTAEFRDRFADQLDARR